MKRVSALLALIPERIRRTPTGSPMPVPRDPAGQESRIAVLARHLSWLTPFNELGPDGQRALGILAARDKPLDRDEDEPEEELLRP
ncbi:MAG TPA: hypothetical protein VEB41_07710 [Burkholderiales bacterium]|nr:hypothetical protein [Burkholderiales bacterium]